MNDDRTIGSFTGRDHGITLRRRVAIVGRRKLCTDQSHGGDGMVTRLTTFTIVTHAITQAFRGIGIGVSDRGVRLGKTSAL